MSSILALFVLLVAAGLVIAYFWARNSQYYTGTSKGLVVIFKGTNYSVLGIPLSSVAQHTGIPVAGLPVSYAQSLGQTTFGSLAAAQESVGTLRQQYQTCKDEFAKLAAWKAHPTKQVRIGSVNGRPEFRTVQLKEPKPSATCMTAPDHPKL